MLEEHIVQVAKTLNDWNPLGENADAIDGLEGYRYEAIDIISAINILPGPNKVNNAIEKVITQAFGIDLNQIEVDEAAKIINSILKK